MDYLTESLLINICKTTKSCKNYRSLILVILAFYYTNLFYSFIAVLP